MNMVRSQSKMFYGEGIFKWLNFADNLERVEFEKYIKIRGQFVLKQIYEYLLNFNNKEVSYSDLSTCIRYDKNLRDQLYIYLATYEECLRAQLFDKYEINKGYTINKKHKDYIKKMAENMYESFDKEYSVLYKIFKLDLGETISLVKELKMFSDEKLKEFENIRVLRNRVMHHNLIVLGKKESLNDVEKNKEKMKSGIIALANNLSDGYGQNFIKTINALRCDFQQYKIVIEA